MWKNKFLDLRIFCAYCVLALSIITGIFFFIFIALWYVAGMMVCILMELSIIAFSQYRIKQIDKELENLRQSRLKFYRANIA